jgi:hypothetical protein
MTVRHQLPPAIYQAQPPRTRDDGAGAAACGRVTTVPAPPRVTIVSAPPLRVTIVSAPPPHAGDEGVGAAGAHA